MSDELALARRLESAEAWTTAAYASAQKRLYPEIGSAVEPIGGGYAVFAGIMSPLSRAVALAMSSSVTEVDLLRLETFYRSRGTPAQVDLCPLADSSLRELLGQHGYLPAEFSNVLARVLSQEENLPPSPPGIITGRIGPTQVDLWVQVVSQSSDNDLQPAASAGTAATAITAAVAAPFCYMPDATCFVAWIEGQPAGAASLAINQGVAGLFATAVLPAYRQYGVARALLNARLAHAAAAGCDLAEAQTEPGSTEQRRLEQLGFRLLYTKPTMVLR